MRIMGALTLAVLLVASAPNAGGQTRPPASSPPVAVGPQYDTTHTLLVSLEAPGAKAMPSVAVAASEPGSRTSSATSIRNDC
jgi:hypothetical protein